MITVPNKKLGGALAAAALLAGGVAVGATVIGDDDRATVQNVAFVDKAATDEVGRDIAAAAQRIFTIRPDAVGSTRKHARALLVGAAVDQYDELYGPYLARARAQGLTLATTVRAIGVTTLEGDKAELLVLADQTGTTSAGQSGVGPAQLVLQASKVDGKWKVAGIELL